MGETASRIKQKTPLAVAALGRFSKELEVSTGSRRSQKQRNNNHPACGLRDGLACGCGQAGHGARLA